MILFGRLVKYIPDVSVQCNHAVEQTTTRKVAGSKSPPPCPRWCGVPPTTGARKKEVEEVVYNLTVKLFQPLECCKILS